MRAFALAYFLDCRAVSLFSMPASARRYLERIEEVTGVPIDMISTSPDRDHTIMMRHPYVAV